MASLSIRLFGKFCICCDEQALKGFDSRKVQELFCYLLLYRNREHSREVLANLLWGDTSTAQSKAYLRKALWQLQFALDSQSKQPESSLVLVEADWIRVNVHADFWLDVAVFEQVSSLIQKMPIEQLDDDLAQTAQNAVALYQADLLEGCYQEWCLYERQRFQHMYLALLEKLMRYCETHREYEVGLDYGMKILQYDRAHEAIHRNIMRLHYLAGNRTSALRQFEYCVTALNEELGVRPAELTVALYEQIRANQLSDSDALPPMAGPKKTNALCEILGRLKQRQASLGEMLREVQRDIHLIEQALRQ